MVTVTDIEYAFETYFSNFINSISLDEKLLAPASKDEWIKRLHSCADFQQSACQENQHLITSFYRLFEEKKEELEASHYDVMLRYCRKLYYARNNEPTILLSLSKSLLPYYERLDDVETLLFLYTCAGYASSQLARTDHGDMVKQVVYYYKKVISYRDSIDTFLLSSSRDYIFIAYNNLIRIAPRLGSISVKEAYSFWQELYSIRTRKKFTQYDTANPRIPLLCQSALDDFLTNNCIADLEGLTFSPEIHAICAEMIKSRFYETKNTSDSLYACPASTVFCYYKLLADEGQLSYLTAWQVLHDYYFKHEEMLETEPEFDYETYYIDYPLILISLLEKTPLSFEEKRPYYTAYQNVLRKFLSRDYDVIETYTISDGVRFATFHPLFLGTFDNAVEKTNFIINSVVSSHLSTLTHSVMVSYLAEAIVKRIFLYCPEYLIAPNSDKKITVDFVLEHQAEILDYTVQSALLHDIGKNGIIPVVTTQHRKLTDYEFHLIRMHPKKGAEYLSADPDFARFKDIALGHHKSYDGKRGYPVDFDHIHSRYCPIINIIHVCDCLDAATDYLSRNYHNAKSFETVVQELCNGKGTEYDPVLVDLILAHTDLYEELMVLTEHNRENIYYDVYLTFVNKHIADIEHLEEARRGI